MVQESVLTGLHSSKKINRRNRYLNLHLVIRIHFGHHSFFQKVKGQHLQYIQLMRHFCFDWSISSYNMLEKKNLEVRAESLHRLPFFAPTTAHSHSLNSPSERALLEQLQECCLAPGGRSAASPSLAFPASSVSHFQMNQCQQESFSEQILFHFMDFMPYHICWFCVTALQVNTPFSLSELLVSGMKLPAPNDHQTQQGIVSKKVEQKYFVFYKVFQCFNSDWFQIQSHNGNYIDSVFTPVYFTAV